MYIHTYIFRPEGRLLDAMASMTGSEGGGSLVPVPETTSVA